MRTTVWRATWVAYLATGFSLVVVSPAAAYIDPSSGSLVFQALVAGIVAIPVAVAAFWRRLGGRFRRRR